MSKEIITEFESRNVFLEVLKNNPGIIIVKFGATWCRPCKRIKPLVDNYFSKMPSNVLCCDIDVDESFDLFAYLKQKKMVKTVPAILCYKKGNISFAPNESVSSSNEADVRAFFTRCLN